MPGKLGRKQDLGKHMLVQFYLPSDGFALRSALLLSMIPTVDTHAWDRQQLELLLLPADRLQTSAQVGRGADARTSSGCKTVQTPRQQKHQEVAGAAPCARGFSPSLLNPVLPPTSCLLVFLRLLGLVPLPTDVLHEGSPAAAVGPALRCHAANHGGHTHNEKLYQPISSWKQCK